MDLHRADLRPAQGWDDRLLTVKTSRGCGNAQEVGMAATGRPGMTAYGGRLVIAGLVPAISLRRAGQEKKAPPKRG